MRIPTPPLTMIKSLKGRSISEEQDDGVHDTNDDGDNGITVSGRRSDDGDGDHPPMTSPQHDNEHDDDEDDAGVLDYRPTPLNACSLETMGGSVRIQRELHSQSLDDTTMAPPAEHVIPMCLGCYQLDETTGRRTGRLDLYAVPVPSSAIRARPLESAVEGSIETFGSNPPLTIIGGENIDAGGALASGVLDGKWYPQDSGNFRAFPQHEEQHQHTHQQEYFHRYYASAHASGEILIHKISSNPTFGGDADDVHPFQATLAGRCDSPSASEGLCLALAWEQPVSTETPILPSSSIDARIVSSYSDGHVAIHRVRSASLASDHRNSPADGDNGELVLTLERHWEAHKMFNTPAEVWCANFIPTEATHVDGSNSGPSHLVVTGGDEGSWKVWDVRAGNSHRLAYTGKGDFDAGVTVLSPHPRRQHLLAVGSYDETIALFDLRTLTATAGSEQRCGTPQKLFHSDPLGGGIWRCKWHPHDDNRLLVAAMHGGCRVLEFRNLEAAMIRSDPADHGMIPSISASIQQKFTKHRSMAYGADWLVHCADKIGDDDDDETGGAPRYIVEAAGSCSFYDRAMYLWKTKNSC